MRSTTSCADRRARAPGTFASAHRRHPSLARASAHRPVASSPEEAAREARLRYVSDARAAQAQALEQAEHGTERQPKKDIVRAVEEVAHRLGNTPRVCRKCYVHPAIIDSYLDGTMFDVARQRADDELGSATARATSDADGLRVLQLLRDRLARAGAS